MTATVSSTPSTPSRQEERSLPHIGPVWIGRIIAALATVAVLAYPLISDDRYYQNMIIISLVFAVGASGLNIITGFTGYVSLGQSAFIGLGGYTIGVLATSSTRCRHGCGCRWPGPSPRPLPSGSAWCRCARAGRRS